MSPPPSAISQCVYGVPLAFVEGTTQIRGFEPQGVSSRHKRFMQESRKWTVGPMPITDFMRYFLASRQEISTEDMLCSRAAFDAVPACAVTLAEIYEPMVCTPVLSHLKRGPLTYEADGLKLAALNQVEGKKRRCPNFMFDNASVPSFCTDWLGSMKPHLCLYREDIFRHFQCSRSEPGSRMDFGYAELFLEVTADPTLDYFTDPPHDATETTRAAHDFVTRSEDARTKSAMDRALGQHISYVAEIFARQHCQFLFTVAMFCSRARLFRWDRMGCVAPSRSTSVLSPKYCAISCGGSHTYPTDAVVTTQRFRWHPHKRKRCSWSASGPT